MIDHMSISTGCYMEKYNDQQNETYDKALIAAISAMLLNVGFEKTELNLLDILKQMVQSLMVDIGRLSKNFSEHAGRTQPMLSDIILSLIEMGIDVTSLPEFLNKYTAKYSTQPLQQQSIPVENKCLKSGLRDNFNYIPDYFPELPDRRTYASTSLVSLKKDKDITESQRESELSETYNIKKSYTQYIANSGDSIPLFDDGNFKVSTVVHHIPAYIPAMLGKYYYGTYEKHTYNQQNSLPLSSPFYSKDGYCYNLLSSNSNKEFDDETANKEIESKHIIQNDDNQGVQKKFNSRKAAILSAALSTIKHDQKSNDLEPVQQPISNDQKHLINNTLIQPEKAIAGQSAKRNSKNMENVIHSSLFLTSLMQDNPYVKLYEGRK